MTDIIINLGKSENYSKQKTPNIETEISILNENCNVDSKSKLNTLKLKDDNENSIQDIQEIFYSNEKSPIQRDLFKDGKAMKNSKFMNFKEK